MKRFVAILTIAMIVLAMSAGTAFASVCVGAACGPVMVCESAATPACPMQSGTAMRHSSCDHPEQAQARDAVPVQQSTHDVALAAAPTAVVPPVLLLGRLTREAQASDARGAPHLSVVIRT